MTPSIHLEEADFADFKDPVLPTSTCSAERGIEQGKKFVRENPIPIVLGALALGISIGLLIPRNNEPAPLSSGLDARIDELKDLLGTLGGKVSSAAGDQYEGLSSAIGCAVKKARKRFHLS